MPRPTTTAGDREDLSTLFQEIVDDSFHCSTLFHQMKKMFTAMLGCSETAERDTECDISGRNIENFMEALQAASKLSADNILEILKLLEVKIISNKMSMLLCQKVTDIIISYLRAMKPEGELEEICTAVLMALGTHCPRMVILKLWDKAYQHNLPPRSLLVAVGKLALCQGTATYIGATWEYVLRLLRMAQDEEDMLVLCQVLSGLVISARKHLDLGSKGGEEMDVTSEVISIRAYHTLRVFFYRWPLKNKSKVAEKVLVIVGYLFYLMPSFKLKNQVNWLTRQLRTLASAKLRPFYISQCICQLLDALALSGSGGVNLASQLENIMDLLFKQEQANAWVLGTEWDILHEMSEKVSNTDSCSVQNHSLALRAFCILTKLYSDQMTLLIRNTMESEDSAKVVLALQVFKEVFHEVPQTEKLRSEVMNSVIVAIQEDRKPVQMALLNFINMLGQYDYLTLPQGNTVINYLIKLSESDPSNEEDIQLMCSKILQMVSLPKLVTLACQPSNILAFVILSKTATELALRARSLGQVPYLSSFHLRPTQFISPQRLLTHLMLCSLKPYREKKFGVSALRLLHALHPITSLHPVLNSNVGQLWMKEIPPMLQILDEHSEKSLSQKEWESRLLQFSSQSLAAINDDIWLEQLATVILEKIRYFSNNEEKAFLYKFFGFNLRTSRSPKLVKTMLSSILDTGHEELQEREGIAEALSIVSLRHLEIVLDQLQEYGTVLTNQHASSILKLMKEHQQMEWGLVCKTIYLSYSKIISQNKRAALLHLDAVLAVVLQHYHHCIVEKDKNLKLYYLDALSQLTSILGSQPVSLRSEIPNKLKLIAFMAELIREEPMNGISSSVRQKAMDIVTDVRKLRPLLEPNDRSELLQTCCKSVLCLPPSEVLQKEAASPKEGQANMELFRETMHSLRRLMEAFITEKPDWIQYCLQLLDIWLNSQKDNERERAMWCAARVLGFTAKMNNFNVEIQFTHLGRLVRMLAMRCQDTMDNICFLSAHAVYNLYCILLLQKQMTRKKQGLWEEEGKSKVYSANMFYNNTLEIAKAFAEYFTQLQLTNLVLTAIEGLTHSKAKVSLAAAQLMSAVMRERGRDMIKIEEVVEGILERLNLQLEPSTKEETLQAMCSLAGSNTHTVVLLLLSKPLPWDRTNLALWKTFGTHRETTINVLQLLIVILEKNQSREETGEMAFRPVAVACALCEMLSGPLCQEAVQELYPRLLVAVLCHLYWVIEQNVPQKMVVYSKEEIPGSKSKTFDPTSCALEVVKLVLLAAAYEGVVVYANKHHCWDLLSSPKSYYIGIMDLASGIVKNCEPSILHRLLNHVRNLLYNVNIRQRILARTFYVQLLWHRSVAQTLGHDFLGNIIRWIKEPDLIMKEIGLRGISNLAVHPMHTEALKSLVPLLRGFLKNEARVTVQAVKSLRNIIYHGQEEDTKVVFCSISKQLRPLINDGSLLFLGVIRHLGKVLFLWPGQHASCSVGVMRAAAACYLERDQVRISATSALGHMLHRVDKFKPGSSVRREIYTFLVPLLLSIQDDNAEVVKACAGALTEWTNVIGWSSLTQTFRHTTLSDHIQVLEETCKHLVHTGKIQLVGELLSQSFGFLKSSQSFLRAAAVTFIGLTAKRLNMNHIHENDVQLIWDALESLKHDPVETVQSLVIAVLKKVDTDAYSQPPCTSKLSRVSSILLKVPKKKMHLFKVVKWEGDNENNQKKKIWAWVQGLPNSLHKWHNRRVKSTPLIIGNGSKRLADTEAPKSKSPPEEVGLV